MRLLVRLVTAIALVAAAVVAPMVGSAVAETGAPVVDGFLDPLYNSAFADIAYTQTGAGGGAGTVNGKLAVIETEDAYYVGFQQGLNAKSNAYCDEQGRNRNQFDQPAADCFQNFRHLVTSDHISFTWTGLDIEGGTLQAGVDILTGPATPGGRTYTGLVRKPGNPGDTDAFAPLGCANLNGLTGFSGMHWNWNTAGWGAVTTVDPTRDSPNFVGREDFPYIYASVAEVRFDKSDCDLPDGLNLTSPTKTEAHNSPEAPWVAEPVVFIECIAASDATENPTGTEADVAIRVVSSTAGLAPVPVAAADVGVTLAPGSVGSIVAVNGTAGSNGLTGLDGEAVITVTSGAQGTSNVVAFVDADHDNTWDAAREPSTVPACPLTWIAPGSITLHKVDDLGAPLAGATFGLFTSSAASGTALATCTTAGAGDCLFDELAPRSYWVRELSAPAGYTPDPDVVAVTVGAGQDVTISQAFVDPLILGSLTIHKSHSLGAPVAGVRFFLLQNDVAADDRGGNLAACTTNAAGVCTIDDLVPGVYTVREDVSTLPPGMNAAADQVVTVTGARTVDVFFVNPLKPLAIDIVKLVNGQKSVSTHSGTQVTYTLTVSNTGEVRLQLTSLLDAVNGAAGAVPGGTCAALVNSFLNAGASTTCTYNASPAVDTTNVASVVGTDIFGRTANDADNAAVDVITPGIALTKLVNGKESVTLHEGDATDYRIEFTNTGDTDLTITSFTDNVFTLPAECRAYVGTTLVPNATRTCTYSSTAPAGGASNTATVVGVDRLGGAKGTVTASDTAVVSVINPDIAIVKTVNGEDDVTVHPGDALEYSFTFTNTGDTPLRITSLVDTAGTTIVDLPAACDDFVGITLQPNGNRTCTYNATAGAAGVVNTVVVTGQDALGESVTARDPATVRVITPAITIRKTVNGAESVTVHPGDDLNYRLVVTNTGTTPLTITSLTDRIGTTNVDLPAACDDLVGTTLNPGFSTACTYAATASTDSINTATVIGVDELGGPKGTVNATDSAAVNVLAPGIAIVKLVNGVDTATVHAGDPLTYTLEVTNSGDAALTITSLTDAANGAAVDLPASCDALVGTTLAIGASVFCTYTTTATADDVDNVATVTGEDELGGDEGTVTDSDDAHVKAINPAITIVKTVNGEEDGVTVHEGDLLTYRLTITNAGDTPLTVTSLIDVANGTTLALPSGCTDLVGEELAAGASTSCNYTVIASGDVENIATVVGIDELDKTVSDTDPALVDVINPAITIVKTVSPDTIAGTSGTATFTFVVTNTGDTVLFDIVVTDDVLGEIGRIASLAPGASQTFTKTASVGAAQPVNVGTVTGTDELGKTVSDDDDATVAFEQASVLGTVIEQAPPAAPAPPVVPPAPLIAAQTPERPAAAPLPRTGTSASSIALTGGLLIITGLAAVYFSQRRVGPHSSRSRPESHH